MRLLNIKEGQQKKDFIQSGAGPELTRFWENLARIRWADEGTNKMYTYDEVIKETKSSLLKYVSRDRAIIELLHIPQGDSTVTEFVGKVEDQALLCRVDETPLTEEDLKRMALIAGFRDRTLAEKCLAEGYDLKQVITTGITRETSKIKGEE